MTLFVRYRQKSLALSSVAAATLALVACGGGGGGGYDTTSATITGVAATGAALGNAAVTGKCSTGVPVTTTTGADGSFTLALSGGQTTPCLLEVFGGTPAIRLHGFAADAGRANITPLTELVMANSLKTITPQAAFDNFTPANASALKLGIEAAKTYVKAQITAFTGGTLATDIMTGIFKVGDADDKVLDALAARLKAGGITLNALSLAAMGSSPFANLVAPIPTPTPTPTTPTPTPTPTPSAGGDCSSSGGIFTVNGNTAQMDNNIYGADGTTVLIGQQNKYLVTTGTTFKGTGGLTELKQTNTSSYTSAAANGTLMGVTVGPTVVNTYYKFGDVDLTIYGLVSTTPIGAVTATSTSTFAPAAVWPSNPALNTPYTKTYTITTDASLSGQTTTLASTQTETRTYSTEQVATMVGTFAACKVKTDITLNNTTTTSYSWTVGSGRLKGHLLKSTTGAGVRSLEATVLLVNGS